MSIIEENCFDSFRSNKESLAISTVVDGKQALFHWSEKGFLK